MGFPGWAYAAYACVGFASLAAMASRASAQDCATDGDCGPGFVCESFGTVDCGFACPEGDEKCEPPPDCMPMEVKGCSPAPCTDDSECAADMVCYAWTYEECSGGAPADGGGAEPGSSGGGSDPGAGGAAGSGEEPAPPPEPTPEPTPAECKEVTESYCAPKYVPPCTQDSDCGPGFTCEEQESCSCAGSAGSAGGAAGAGGEEPAPPPEPVEPDCTCEKTGEFYCQLIETACASAAECPDGFTCETNPESAVCSRPTEPAGAGGASGEGDGGAAGSGSGDEPVDSCGPTTEPEKVCLPPYWNTGFGGPGRGGDVTAFSESGAANGGPSMATGAPGAGAPGEDPATATGTDDGAAANTGGDGGFCAVTAPGSARGMGLVWSFVALSLLAMRRRRSA
jgi:hypothetical protein